MKQGTPAGQLRLAELIAALSLGIDLGFAQPMEHVLRQCLIGLRLADRLGLDEQSRAVVYYAGLLTNVGCHSDAHEQAKWFGDDIALKSGKYRGFGLRGAASTLMMLGGVGNPALHRFRVGVEFMLSGRHELEGSIVMHTKLAHRLASELGLSQGVLDALGSAYECWDGHGWPGTLAGQAVPVASRIVQLAEFVEVAQRMGGKAAVIALSRKQSGKQFDPALAALVVEDADAIFASIEGVQTWDAVIAAEPALAVVLSEEQFDAALLAIANFADLKSPYTLGHSSAVAGLVGAAAVGFGLPRAEVRMLERAGLVHDFGRLGISNGILDKAGPLGAGERERVRMLPYFTERMLHQSALLAPLGAIAVQHRERMDGSGYPRGISGAAITPAARLLAAADAYQAMREPRPYRPAHTPDDAAATLRAEAHGGRFDDRAVEAVLAAAGHRARRRPERPAGLTAREVEVLRLVARGLSTKQIAERLGMSPKTAGNHIEHIYSKIDATNRVTASLFAVEHGLLPDEDVEPS